MAVGRPDWRTPSGPVHGDCARTASNLGGAAFDLGIAGGKGALNGGVVPPGPENPLGDFWIGLSLAGIGIHSTNVPSSIYGAVSHGCIRMHPDDIAQLFAYVHVGAAGLIIYEPVVLTASDDGVYLEVHRDVSRRAVTEPRAVARKLASAIGVSDRVDWTLADSVVAAREGIPRNVTRVPRGQ